MDCYYTSSGGTDYSRWFSGYFELHRRCFWTAQLWLQFRSLFMRGIRLPSRLYFTGDRPADLLQVKVSDILCFPANSGFLFNHIWTKSFRSGDANVFAFKRGSNKSVCQVRGLEIYFNICKLLGIKLAPGFLFRSVTKSNLSPFSLGSAARSGEIKNIHFCIGQAFVWRPFYHSWLS